MNYLKDIIQRCHQRREKPLRQRKTVITPAIYKGLLYHFTVSCAQKYPVRLYDLEQAGISFMPVGGAPDYDRVPPAYDGRRFLKRQKVEDWVIWRWDASWGIQVYTGIPSERNGARWHDVEFTYEAICAAPDAVLACIKTLVDVVANPLLVLTKSGGLRFSCRVPHYLHPNTEAARYYVYKDIPTAENTYQRDVYLEILGDEGHSPWDGRYEILVGDLLNPPVIAKEVLFTTIGTFREAFHDPKTLETEKLEPRPQVVIASLPSLGSHKLDLAKEAFIKRRFTYLRQENNFHHWAENASGDGTDVLLWERDDTVWIRASTPDVGLPTEDTPITEVWDDTGILPLFPATAPSGSEEMLAVREGQLSPLAIKRPSPVLQKPEDNKKVYEPLENNITQLQNIFDSDARVIGLTAEIGARNNYEMESHLLKRGDVNFNGEFLVVEEAVQHFQRQNLPSLVRRRDYGFRWNQVKEIPVAERMANPFQHGNVCEDADRSRALVRKGIDPSESICPECPVYTECQERGYLSQPAALRRAKTQISGFSQLLLDPNYSTRVEEILKPFNDTERLCIIDVVETNDMFLGHGISKDGLKAWSVNWQGRALGNFAQALLNTLETESEPDDVVIKRLRIVMQAFQPHEAEIVEQMCRVNVRCKVIEQGTVDDETGEELARFAVAFEGGVSAYIPLNEDAADRLTTEGLSVFQLDSFVLDEDTSIPMSIQQAIRLGILNAETVEKIQEFPIVYRNPEWTFWHQLKRFFAHYTRDADAPIIWYDNALQFWTPSVLHPNVKRLLLMSATLSDQDFRRMFPDEEMETIRIVPTPWVAGNQVFQIRTGVHTLQTILDYDSTWDVIGLSEAGERFFLGICSEIERDPNVKHAILTYNPVIEQLGKVAEKENVCLVTEFKRLHNLETAFEAADVVWIVGTPPWSPGVIWQRAQILYGNDDEPLCYEADTEFQHYKDERVQRVYTRTVAELITEIVGRAGLNRWNGKKVVLINSLNIPDITDRPETLLFDWEDFEVAGSLDKLAETIAVRERFETEREQLTAESPREEVERILGCSQRQANRVLQKLRGGAPRVTFYQQILSLLADGEKKTSELMAAIDGHPQAIHKELLRLTKLGEIEKVRRGVYALPKTSSSK